MLATEGAANLMYRWSRRMFAELVRIGLEWEDGLAVATPTHPPR